MVPYKKNLARRVLRCTKNDDNNTYYTVTRVTTNTCRCLLSAFNQLLRAYANITFVTPIAFDLSLVLTCIQINARAKLTIVFP